jgi:ABC-type multidrug transport system fused ATPase/permease subunit
MFGIIIENPNHYLLMANEWKAVAIQSFQLAMQWLGPGPVNLIFGRLFIPDFGVWMNGGIPIYAALAAALGFLHFLKAKRWNPVKALGATVSAFFGAIFDFIRLPLGLRRILAIAKVAALEALRGQVLYVFGLFLIPMAFAGWYLPKTPEGTLLYLVGYLNTAITYTLLPMAAFLVAMSLPKDIQSRIIQTVVTKPVRRLEIVIGRIVGFTAVFTLVLALMAGASLAYLWGQLTPDEREKYWVARAPIYANSMPLEARQQAIDQIMVDRKDFTRAAAEKAIESNEGAYSLMFKRKEGWQSQGMNVGKEWYGQRWHIPGSYNGTASAAFGFNFDQRAVGIVQDEKSGKKFVRVFAECDIFKTNKGDARREEGVGKDFEKSGVFGQITVKGGGGPDYVMPFSASHLRAVELLVPAEHFSNGRVEIWLRCLTPSQFLGVGRSDVYFLTRETSFAANFLKGMSSIWLKLFFLIVVAVAASAALKGFVAVLATVSVFTLGSFWQFLAEIVDPRKRAKSGGGPLESLYRLFTQSNQVTPMDDSIFSKIVITVDNGILTIMEKAAFLVPNLADLDTIEYVARGIDLPWALVVRNGLFVATFALPVILAGHLVLKHRELAAS